MQDIALAFNELFLRVARRPPLFLHVPGDVLKAEGVDALSREVAADRTRSQSTPVLRALAHREAARQAQRFAVDLFATAENAVVPRFFAPFPEPLAEADDALSVADWGQSWCPHCQAPHREFAFVFPPRHLLARTLAKARADGLHPPRRQTRLGQPSWRPRPPQRATAGTTASSSPRRRPTSSAQRTLEAHSGWQSLPSTSRASRAGRS